MFLLIFALNWFAACHSPSLSPLSCLQLSYVIKLLQCYKLQHQTLFECFKQFFNKWESLNIIPSNRESDGVEVRLRGERSRSRGTDTELEPSQSRTLLNSFTLSVIRLIHHRYWWSANGSIIGSSPLLLSSCWPATLCFYGSKFQNFCRFYSNLFVTFFPQFFCHFFVIYLIMFLSIFLQSFCRFFRCIFFFLTFFNKLSPLGDVFWCFFFTFSEFFWSFFFSV